MLKSYFNKSHYLYGALSFILYAISLLIGHSEESANHIYILIKIGLIFISVLLFFFSCSNISSERIKSQYSILSLGILIYELMLMIATGKTILYIRDYPAIFSNIMWLSVSAVSFIRFKKSFISFFSNLFKDRESINLIISSLATALIVIILSIEPNGVRFSWDSETLYEFIYGLDYESLYDAKLLTFHSHVSVIYAHILVLFKLMFKDIRSAFFLLNALCVICASLGTTFLFRSLLPNRHVIDYILGTILFIFSPWVCGLSTYHIYDYYIWCLFPLLILFLSTKNWIGYWVIGVFITYSKATGLIVFGSTCAGILITDFVYQYKTSKSFIGALKKVLSDIKYWYFLSVAVVFFLFFRTGIAESTQFEDTVIGFDPAHIIHQLKLYSVCNFNWILMILAILCVIHVFITKRFDMSDSSKNTLVAILISDLLFFLFNCLCITYRIPRYMDSHIAVIYILGAVFLLCLTPKTLKYSLIVLISTLTFIAGFRSIDPVSKIVFNTINVGDHTIVDYEMSSTPSFEDSIICNREYYSYEVLLNQALNFVMNDRDNEDDILFSLSNDPITWGFSGGRYSYGLQDGKQYFELFYDTTINGLANGYSYEYYSSPVMIPFEMRYVFPKERINDVLASSESGVIYYLYMPTLNSQKETELYETNSIITENQFTYRGWQMNCIKLKK